MSERVSGWVNERVSWVSESILPSLKKEKKRKEKQNPKKTHHLTINGVVTTFTSKCITKQKLSHLKNKKHVV